MPEPVEVIAGAAELAPYGRIWGTGGWLMPQLREALDWVTFVRLLGWGVRVSVDCTAGEGRWVLVALSPENISGGLVRELEERLQSEQILVVVRAAVPGSALEGLSGVSRLEENIEGDTLEWRGPGPVRRWECPERFVAQRMAFSPGTLVWATTNGIPIIAARQAGCGVIASLAFHPSEARDRNGAATALLRELLIRGIGQPTAWLDFQGTLVLRMDDPGGAQNIYSRSWQYPKLGLAAWRDIGADLRAREGRLSVCYVAGWVDDGDASRGRLKIAGRDVERIPGAIYPSPLVTLEEASGLVQDYREEFEGIEELRRAGLAEVELHGYTHIHPDRSAWLRAADRYDSVLWYRELGVDALQSPLEPGLKAIERWFHTRPAALICPGDEWNTKALECALDLGFDLVSSYYLAIRDSGKLLWATHVCAPYLNKPDDSWFQSGLPVIGYFHDRELALEGVGWMSRHLDAWQRAGARRFLDLRELAGALAVRIGMSAEELCVTTSAEVPPVRSIPLGVYAPGKKQLSIVVNGRTHLRPSIDESGFGTVSI